MMSWWREREEYAKLHMYNIQQVYNWTHFEDRIYSSWDKGLQDCHNKQHKKRMHRVSPKDVVPCIQRYYYVIAFYMYIGE